VEDQQHQTRSKGTTTSNKDKTIAMSSKEQRSKSDMQGMEE
jgi:hypothetical protein